MKSAIEFAVPRKITRDGGKPVADLNISRSSSSKRHEVSARFEDGVKG
jgi:hypothetical protein